MNDAKLGQVQPIIKPRYSAEQLKKMDQDNTCKWENRYYAIFRITNTTLNIICLFLSLTIIDSDKYKNMMISAITKFFLSFNDTEKVIGILTETIKTQGANLSLGESFIALLIIITTFFLIYGMPTLIVFQIKGVCITKPIGRYLIKKGYIIKSPFRPLLFHEMKYDKYEELIVFYKRAEEVIKLLTTHDKTSLFYDEQEDKVRITIINPVLSKETNFSFGPYTSKIFTENQIDFSVLDKEVDEMLNKPELVMSI